MISSDVDVPHAFKNLCKLINQGKIQEIINMVEDPILADFLSHCLNENQLER
jgi:hypothetical protein